MNSSYRTDLAYIHDEGFSGYSLSAAPGVLRHLRENGADRGLVVDLGCGSGVLARQLGFAGYDVLGIDHSAAMIRLARKRAPSARFEHASITDFKLPRCSAVVSIGEVLSFAFSETQETALDNLFRRVFRALKNGGIFLFDFGQTGRLPGGMPRQGFWKGADWAILLEVEPSEEETEVLTRRLTTFRKAGDCYRRREELHKLRLFHGSDILWRLQQAGFEAKLVRSFGSLRFRSGHGGAIARKPASAL
ncbi:MAG: class I SAM-dependent methyltransferase [Bryobacteraceae bacterium]|nr:class I SAM-dependent methyltransferase [Bryobacteraceae bacterium]